MPAGQQEKSQSVRLGGKRSCPVRSLSLILKRWVRVILVTDSDIFFFCKASQSKSLLGWGTKWRRFHGHLKATYTTRGAILFPPIFPFAWSGCAIYLVSSTYQQQAFLRQTRQAWAGSTVASESEGFLSLPRWEETSGDLTPPRVQQSSLNSWPLVSYLHFVVYTVDLCKDVTWKFSCCHSGHNTCRNPFPFPDTSRLPLRCCLQVLSFSDVWISHLGQRVYIKGGHISCHLPFSASCLWVRESLAIGLWPETSSILRTIQEKSATPATWLILLQRPRHVVCLMLGPDLRILPQCLPPVHHPWQ